MTSLPLSLITAVAAMGIGQFWKLISPIFRGRPPELMALFKSGGMPSAHSAFTLSLALSLGFREGFTSGGFAVAAVLTALTIHDAIKVRGTLQRVVRLLKKIAPEEYETEGPFPESVGHDLAEVVTGAILGVAVATAAHLILP